MGGPIVRTGTNPQFWEGWDRVFAKGKKQAVEAAPAAPKAAKAKPAKAKAAKAKKSK